MHEAKAERIYIGVVAFATVAYFFLPKHVQSNLYNLIGFSAASAMLFGAWWRRHEPQPAWYMLGLGVLLLAIGNVLFGQSQPVPSIADMFYISAYPLLVLGLSGLAPWRGSGSAGRNFALASAIAGGVVLIAWAFLIFPAGREDVNLLSKLVAGGYPPLDLVLIALLIRAALRRETERNSLKYLGVAFLLLLGADLVYAAADFGADYELGGAPDAAWLLSYAFLGAALLSPSLQSNWLDSVQPVLSRREAVMGTLVMADRSARTVIPTPAQALRFGVIAMMSGRMLLGLGAASLFLGMSWHTVEIVFLGGACATTGALMTVATSFRR